MWLAILFLAVVLTWILVTDSDPSGLNEYHCIHCDETVYRRATWLWSKSYCGAEGRTVLLWRVFW